MYKLYAWQRSRSLQFCKPLAIKITSVYVIGTPISEANSCSSIGNMLWESWKCLPNQIFISTFWTSNKKFGTATMSMYARGVNENQKADWTNPSQPKPTISVWFPIMIKPGSAWELWKLTWSVCFQFPCLLTNKNWTK